MSVERANGLLKMMYKICYYGIRARSINQIVKQIGAACVLHNITLKNAKEFIIDNELEVRNCVIGDRYMRRLYNYTDSSPPDSIDAVAEQAGRRYRDSLCSQITVEEVDDFPPNEHDYWFRHFVD